MSGLTLKPNSGGFISTYLPERFRFQDVSAAQLPVVPTRSMENVSGSVSIPAINYTVGGAIGMLTH